ncbi:MAG: hypothetical protein ACRECX_06610 [Methyloceanibacter sp.]|uniref:hypothetical protein n=1 Tax=Methyloceanibacter sp. TaxID=1965321 RepID=UPI003D6CCCF0
MKWHFLRADTPPRPPPGPQAVAIMAAVGVLTGLISAIPSPLPDIRLDDTGLLINAEVVPLHAGIAFGAAIAAMLWLWVARDPAKCLLAMALVLIGWLAAVNTANDVFTATVGSELFGTVEGAKARRETIGLLLAGLSGGAIGAGLTAFGSGIPAEAIRRPRAWMLIVVVGALLGLLLYPAADLDALVILFVPWQAAVAAAIAYGLTRA